MLNNSTDKMKKLENSYNEIPYMSKSFYNTQPIKLKTNLKLLNFDSPELENAKVLEIGCSFGGNIILFALSYPKAKVIGLDLSEVQINEGRKIIEHLGIDNIELLHQNVLEYDTDEKFDYILCHGVYSWIPTNVQDAILKIVKKNLSEKGLAVISYNTYPGWKSLEIMKDAMLFRDQYLTKRGIEINKDNKVSFGRGAVEFLKDYSFLNERVKSGIDSIKDKSDYYILHEYYEVFNKPIYLYDFNEKLNENGLQHIMDSDFSKSFPIFGEEIETKINNECGGDYIAREQYYDYLSDMQFRSSIITHKDNIKDINISKHINISDLKELYYRGNFDQNEKKLYVTQNETEGNEEKSQILEFISSKYPANVSIEEIEKHLKDKVEPQEIYKTMINLVYTKDIELFEKKINYKKQDKLKLLPRYRKYLEYFASEHNPIIGLASRTGIDYQLGELTFKAQTILSYFDGTKTDEEIVKDLLKREKKGEISATITNGDTLENVIKGFVKNLRNIVEACFFNAEI